MKILASDQARKFDTCFGMQFAGSVLVAVGHMARFYCRMIA